jgi:hypothetical protein
MLSDAQWRPMVGPLEGLVPGVSRLLYHAPASQRGAGCMHAVRGMLQPWTCACLPGVSASLTRSRYVQVYDNKIEINEPDSIMVSEVLTDAHRKTRTSLRVAVHAYRILDLCASAFRLAVVRV